MELKRLTAAYKRACLVPILTQLNPVHALPNDSSKGSFNIIFPCGHETLNTPTAV